MNMKLNFLSENHCELELLQASKVSKSAFFFELKKNNNIKTTVKFKKEYQSYMQYKKSRKTH